MLPLFDMMLQAENGHAMEVMARQFGLAQEQMAKATAALMPAFSTALKRNAANPYDFGAFLTAMGSGNHLQYFEDMSKAFTDKGLADGNGILGQLFGSKEVSRAIAAQAAQMTGIGQEVYKQMLPVMATALMGGLFKQATDQMTGQMTGANNPFAPMMQSWLEASGFARKPEPAPNPFDNPFTQAMQAFLQPKSVEKKPEPADLFANNPFMKAFQDMMSPAEKEKPPEKGPLAPFTDMISTMFDSGIEAQKEYQKTIDALFDSARGKSE